MRETKGYFNKISNDLDSALSKNAATSRSRPAELEDASNLLTATKSCFRYTGMDYVYQISMLQSRKRYIVLDSLGNVYTKVQTAKYELLINQRKLYWGENREQNSKEREIVRKMNVKNGKLERKKGR